MSILDSQEWDLLEAQAATEEENRLHRRFSLPLSARYMRPDKTEHSCMVRDISVGGVSVTLSGPADSVAIGERVVLYVEHLGVLEGPVVQVSPHGFAFRLTATQHKREKLASQITFLLNEQDMQGAAQRKHQRIIVGNHNAELTVTGGVVIPCLILDVSASGASLACKSKPEIDIEVRLLGLRARVVRHHQEGIGVQFVDILDLDTVQAYFG